MISLLNVIVPPILGVPLGGALIITVLESTTLIISCVPLYPLLVAIHPTLILLVLFNVKKLVDDVKIISLPGAGVVAGN